MSLIAFVLVILVKLAFIVDLVLHTIINVVLQYQLYDDLLNPDQYKQTFSNRMDLMARKILFIPMPLACLTVTVLFEVCVYCLCLCLCLCLRPESSMCEFRCLSCLCPPFL